MRWFEKEFSDDIGEPVALLCWALILNRIGKNGEKKFAETMLSNIYLIPLLLGAKMAKVDMEHSSNFEEPEFLDYLPERIKKGITAEDKKWMESCYFSDKFQAVLKHYIKINKALLKTPVGERRSALVEEEHSLLDEWQ